MLDGEANLAADKSMWSPILNELVEKGTVSVTPYDLVFEYDYWTYGMALVFGALG